MPRGAKPGEYRGGRKKGTPNKSRHEYKELLASYADEAIDKIVQLMHTSPNPQVQLAAASTILDRGYGKATERVEHTGEDGAPILGVLSIVKELDGRECGLPKINAAAQ